MEAVVDMETIVVAGQRARSSAARSAVAPEVVAVDSETVAHTTAAGHRTVVDTEAAVVDDQRTAVPRPMAVVTAVVPEELLPRPGTRGSTKPSNVVCTCTCVEYRGGCQCNRDQYHQK